MRGVAGNVMGNEKRGSRVVSGNWRGEGCEENKGMGSRGSLGK